jgi:hypothetical protein
MNRTLLLASPAYKEILQVDFIRIVTAAFVDFLPFNSPVFRS